MSGEASGEELEVDDVEGFAEFPADFEETAGFREAVLLVEGDAAGLV